MRIMIKATRLTLTPSIQTYIDEKIGSLGRFLKPSDSLGVAEARIEIERTTAHHHKGDVFRAEADIRLPGKILRADHADKDMRIAIDKLRNKLRAEIEKYKTAHSKRERRREK